MACIQFLNGSRAEELVELNPAATVIVGSAHDVHIQVTDPDVVGSHCQLYPAEGSYWLQDLGEGFTVLNAARLASTAVGLRPYDVFIRGKTFLRFLAEPPRCSSCGPESTAWARGGKSVWT